MIIIHCLQVESLTAARKSALNGQEPSDAIRVVNAFLTQIDQIKRQVLQLSCTGCLKKKRYGNSTGCCASPT
jgi:hypothetical protein